MSEGNSPELKTSNRPPVQERVQTKVDTLKTKFPESSDEQVNTQARDRVASELYRERMQAEIQKHKGRAVTDELTGFLNSAGFNDMLHAEGSRISRSGKSAAVVILDANGLKALNDTKGHKAGDEFLKRIAEILDRSTRESDVKAFSQTSDQKKVARWGGDEFGVVLSDTDFEGALTWWTRASKNFRDEGITIGAGMQMVDSNELAGKSQEEIKGVMTQKKEEADIAMLMLAKPQSKDTNEPVLVAYNSIPEDQRPLLAQKAQEHASVQKDIAA